MAQYACYSGLSISRNDHLRDLCDVALRMIRSGRPANTQAYVNSKYFFLWALFFFLSRPPEETLALVTNREGSS